MQTLHTPEEIINAVTWRRAVKVFDTGKKVSEADLHTILEAGRMAPSAYGVESWKFIVVTNPETRTKLRETAYGQAQVTDASHLVVIARDTNGEKVVHDLLERTAAAQGKLVADLAGFKKMLDGAVAAKTGAGTLGAWLAAQTYIPLGFMMSAASMMGIDNAGMEGFDTAKVDEILGLAPQSLSAQTFLVLGYRGDDAWSKGPKVRRSSSEVVQTV